MVIKVVAATLLAAFLWGLLRLALGLRWVKLSREAARRAEEERGRRVVAELPLPSGEVVLLLEDDRAIWWGAVTATKDTILGARLVMNGGILAECVRPPFAPPAPVPPDDFDGRERWEVVLYLAGGGAATIPCGTLREGVSREIASRVYEAVRAALTRGSNLSSHQRSSSTPAE
jgi:hypothetical protein